MINIYDLNPSKELLSHLPGILEDCLHCRKIGFTDWGASNDSFDSLIEKMLKASEVIISRDDDYYFLHGLSDLCGDCKLNSPVLADNIMAFFVSRDFGYSFGIED